MKTTCGQYQNGKRTVPFTAITKSHYNKKKQSAISRSSKTKRRRRQALTNSCRTSAFEIKYTDVQTQLSVIKSQWNSNTQQLSGNPSQLLPSSFVTSCHFVSKPTIGSCMRLIQYHFQQWITSHEGFHPLST